MPSTFTWLDYSEHERRKMLDVIDLFRERDTRDELGISPIRDAFADTFFPGTSTIQTRARYFLFIPWLYLDIERRPAPDVAAQMRQKEVALIQPLIKLGGTTGVIGGRVGANVKRLPSNIYWLGLETWGIRLFHGSQEQYHRALAQRQRHLPLLERTDDGEPIDGVVTRFWHASLPNPPPGFPSNASFALTLEEAAYLRERIITCCRDTLLCFLVDRGRPTEWTSFPWQHPQWAEFPPPIQERLEHARLFSEVMHGAALLYNLMLAQAARREMDETEYAAQMDEWASMVEKRDAALQSWDLVRFWSLVTERGAHVGWLTRLFVEEWVTITRASAAAPVHPDRKARQLIEAREQALKGPLARLKNPRALELWSGHAGTGRLDYRWSSAQTLLADILPALHGPAAHA